MLFAAVLLLCFSPFMIVANALAGQSAVTGLVRDLGLNQQAARDVSALFTSSSATSNAVTGTAYLFFVLGGIAAAAAVQDLYERSFELESGGLKDIGRRFVWLTVTVGWVSLVAVAGPWLHNAGGLWLVAILGFFGLTLFWWGTMWFLLSARVLWRALLPSTVATALFWVGMEVVFSFIFSGTVISDDKKYGPIGVVPTLMSWLIAIGVVIILRSSGRTCLARTRSLLLQGIPLAPAIVGPKNAAKWVPSRELERPTSIRERFSSVR